MTTRNTIRGRMAAIVLAGAIATGGAVVPSVVSAQPAQAFDSITQLCAGMSKTGPNYKKCMETSVRAHKPLPGELKCYKGAGIAMGALAADAWITKAEARTIGLRLIAAGAFGCIGAWLL